MTLEEYVEWLAGKAMGWLGWSYQDTMDSDMNAVEIGYLERVEMLRSIFGGGKKETGPKPGDKPPQDAHGNPIVMGSTLFDQVFGQKIKQIRKK